MTEDPNERFDRQRRLGPLALLRLRAEVLLEHERDGDIALTDAERSELDRIAVAATEADRAFLGSFDSRLNPQDD